MAPSLAGRDGVDGELGAGDNVAAHKDVGLGRLIGDGVGFGAALLVGLTSAPTSRPPQSMVWPMAPMTVLTGEGLVLAGGNGLAAALFVGIAQLHELDL
jgi:hypothetical protein